MAGPGQAQDKQDVANWLTSLFGGYTPGDPEKEKIMREILAQRTVYDTESDNAHRDMQTFLEVLDHNSQRQVIFVDPLKLQSAQAYGISPIEFLGFALHEKGLYANSFQLYQVFNAAAGTYGTAPCAMPVTDLMHLNAADIVVPKSHLRQPLLDMPGLSQQDITKLVNYHEFFHCLHDKYAQNHLLEDTPQKREMFADVGACIEMMRQGQGADVVDKLIVWRMKGKDDAHQTVPALLALKQYMNDHGGAAGIRNLKPKDVLDLAYKSTEEGSSMSWISRLQNLVKEMPELSRAARQQQNPTFSFKDLPFGTNPAKILEDKAMALGGKITPATLTQANNALQGEYAQQEKAHPETMGSTFMAAYVENAYQKLVKGEDYALANSKWGAKLTAEDAAEISFVQKKPSKLASAAPVTGSRR